MLSSVQENTVAVEYSDMIQPVAGSASTSGSTTGSRNTISTEWLSNESLTLRSSTLRQSRSFQEQVAIGVAPPTSTNSTRMAGAMSPVSTPNRVRVVQDVVPTHTPVFSVEFPERTSAPITNYGNQAILNDRINDRRHADDYARKAHDAQARAFLAKQEQQIRLATQKAEWDNVVQVAENKAAIQLVEAEAETAMQLIAIRYRDDIQAAETKAAHEAQLQHIRQIESQRTAMTPTTNPGVQTTSDPLPVDNYDVTMEGP
jgi:hypothetical protein